MHAYIDTHKSQNTHASKHRRTDVFSFRLCDECYARHSTSQLVAAETIPVGGRILVQDVLAGGATLIPATVVEATNCSAKVRYIVTDSDYLIVDGVAASTYSSVAAALETAPFHFLAVMAPGLLQHPCVEASLHVVLESPALRVAEEVLDACERVWAWSCGSLGLPPFVVAAIMFCITPFMAAAFKGR